MGTARNDFHTSQIVYCSSFDFIYTPCPPLKKVNASAEMSTDFFEKGDDG